MVTNYEQEIFGLERELDKALQLPNLFADVSADLRTLQSHIAAVEYAVQVPTVTDMVTNMAATYNPTENLEVAAMMGEYNRIPNLAQEGASTLRMLNVDALNLSWQHTDASYYPLNQYMSDLSTVADIGAVASSWKPVLMRQSWIPETSFVAQMPVAEQTPYSAIRPEILSVADQLGRAFQLPQQNLLVDYMGTPFELDFDFYLDLDAPHTDELPVTAPQTRRPVVLRRLVVWIADRPETVEFLGLIVGEAAGVGANVMMDGVAGELVGNVGGGALGYALGKTLVVVVNRCRGRL